MGRPRRPAESICIDPDPQEPSRWVAKIISASLRDPRVPDSVFANLKKAGVEPVNLESRRKQIEDNTCRRSYYL
jgi:hypothetical protein